MKKQSLTTALQITSVQFLFMLNDYTTVGWFMWLWWWNQVGFKNKYKKLSAGWAQEGREVTSFESTVVGGLVALERCLTCPSVSPRLSICLTCHTKRQRRWLMIPWKKHSSLWQNQRSQITEEEPFITLYDQLLTLPGTFLTTTCDTCANDDNKEE